MPKPELKLPVSEFVKQIVTDPAKHIETLLLTGFVGPSSEKEHTRLYFDPQLSQYVEIPNKAILYSQAMAPEASPLGAVYLWIEPGAQLVHGKAGTDRAKAKFFEGPIAQGAATPATPPMACPVTPACHTPIVCTSTCPTHVDCTVTCPTRVGCTATCPTRVDCTVTCPTHVGCTATCPTHVGCTVACPTHVDCTVACPTNSVTACVPCQTPHLACVTQSVACHPTIVGCQTVIVACQTVSEICHPTAPGCQSAVNCPSIGACPTVACGTIACQSAACGVTPNAGFAAAIPATLPMGCAATAACHSAVCTPACPTHVGCTATCPTHVDCTVACPTQVGCTAACPTHVECTVACPTRAVTACVPCQTPHLPCVTQSVACHPTVASCETVNIACSTQAINCQHTIAPCIATPSCPRQPGVYMPHTWSFPCATSSTGCSTLAGFACGGHLHTPSCPM